MSTLRTRPRMVALLVLVAAAGCVLAACAPRIPPAPPRPSDDTTGTSGTSESAPPVEYSGTIVEPKNDTVSPELHSPAPGSAERAAILDALRGPVEGDLGQPVVFKVNTIRAQGEWAFVRATPLQPGGNRIDYLNTQFREQVENGAFDDSVDALVKNTNGAWQPVIYVIGATDVAWALWPQDYGAPEALFATP